MKTGQATPTALQPTLARELGLFDATAITVGTIIGSGIFLVPTAVAAQLASPAMVLLVWVAGGVLSLFGALSLAEMAAAFPGAGGLYVYLRQAYGSPVGFLYGWTLLFMIHSGSIATLAVAFGIYTAQFYPLTSVGQKGVAVVCVLLLTGVNCLGVRAGKWVQNIFTVAKVGGLAAMTFLIFVRPKPLAGLTQGFWPQAPLAPAWTQFGVALVAVLWAYEGWHVVSFAAGEIKRPARVLPRSLLYGILIITLAYLLANSSYYAVLTGEEIQQTDRVAAAAITRVLGTTAAGFISLLILVSIFGAMNGMILTGPRVYYAMAQDGLFFSAFARLNARYRTPILAILVQGAWAAGLSLLGTFQQLFTYVIFTAWIFYGAAVAAVVVLRRRQPELVRPFRVPGFPWLPAIFCAAAVGITLSTVVADPRHALLGIVLILVGLPVYALFRRQAGLKVG